MNIINSPILQCETEKEFKQFFLDEVLGESFVFLGYEIKILEEDFDHICYEEGKGRVHKGQFSIRRSRRLPLIKAICDGVVPYKIIYQTERENKSICVLCEEIEAAIYLRPVIDGTGRHLRLRTLIAFGKDVNKKIEKQLSQGELIEDIEKIFTEAA